MANREVIVISDDESDGKDNIAIVSELELTREQVLSAGRNIMALLSKWLQVINTAIVSAAMIYMLLNNSTVIKEAFQRNWLSLFASPDSSPFLVLVTSAL